MTDATHAPDSRVRARTSGGLGHLTLDRPEAINALDLGMIRDLDAALDAWSTHPDVQLVLLDGSGERGFCAGGDVRGLYEQIVAGEADETGGFFREEYALNARLAEYPKPVVVFADGITMGGGIGLAGHAAIRVVTERSRLAMPETRIGFTPDVGGTWLLAHAPGRLGEYLGMTGASMTASDAIYAGFADHFVPSDRLSSLAEALETRADPPHAPSTDRWRDLPSLGARGPASATELVLLFDESVEPGRLRADQVWIDEAFSADTVAGIIDRLRASDADAASATADTLEQLSPTALSVTLAAVRAARELPDLRAALAQEYALVMWFATTQPDLREGIRAQLVDKDRTPKWSPAAIADVPAERPSEALAHRPRVPLWS